MSPEPIVMEFGEAPMIKFVLDTHTSPGLAIMTMVSVPVPVKGVFKVPVRVPCLMVTPMFMTMTLDMIFKVHSL